MDPSARLYHCARCHCQVILCRRCDRGQVYCADDRARKEDDNEPDRTENDLVLHGFIRPERSGLIIDALGWDCSGTCNREWD